MTSLVSSLNMPVRHNEHYGTVMCAAATPQSRSRPTASTCREHKKPPVTQMTGGSNKDQGIRTTPRPDLISRFQQMLFLGCRAGIARIACCFLGGRTWVAGTTGGLGSRTWVAGTTGSFLGSLAWVARCVCRNVADNRRQDNCTSSKTQDNRKSSSA